MAYAKDIKGQRFGRLVAVSYLTNGDWICQCDCGKEVTKKGTKLRKGLVKSCGCFRRDYISNRNTSHGKTKTYLYRLWLSIKTRCYNSNGVRWEHYGGRGIIMYETWIDDFEKFEDWIIENLGDRPEGYSLDRIENDGNYEPGNLRWADFYTQNNNRSI